MFACSVPGRVWACLAVGMRERASRDSPKTALRQSRHKQCIYLFSHFLSALRLSWNCHIKECVCKCVVCFLSKKTGSRHFCGWLLSAKIRPVFCGCFCGLCCWWEQMISLLSSRSMAWKCHWWATGIFYTESQHMVDTSLKDWPLQVTTWSQPSAITSNAPTS